jgi:cytochrome c2
VQRLTTADATAGQLVASTRCSSCHTLNEGGAALIGPNLFGIVGRPVGIVEGFAYSPAMQALRNQGATWTLDRLEAFILSPQSAVPGTRMGFLGLPDDIERANLLGYLRTLTTGPVPPLPTGDAATAQPRTNGLAPLAFAGLQSVRGRNVYDDVGCGDCHGPTLRGVEPASDHPGGPALRGDDFAARWFNGNVWELYKLMRDTMPPTEAGGYTGDVYITLLAFILRENGLVAQDVWLDPDRAVLEGMGFYP